VGGRDPYSTFLENFPSDRDAHFDVFFPRDFSAAEGRLGSQKRNPPFLYGMDLSSPNAGVIMVPPPNR